MKSNYGAADWSLYAWKRSSSSSERENSAHNLLHEVFILHKKTDLLVWNDLAPRSQLRKDFMKTLQPSVFSCSDRAVWWVFNAADCVASWWLKPIIHRSTLARSNLKIRWVSCNHIQVGHVDLLWVVFFYTTGEFFFLSCLFNTSFSIHEQQKQRNMILWGNHMSLGKYLLVLLVETQIYKCQKYNFRQIRSE